jgi:hypothetical protein
MGLGPIGHGAGVHVGHPSRRLTADQHGRVTGHNYPPMRSLIAHPGRWFGHTQYLLPLFIAKILNPSLHPDCPHFSGLGEFSQEDKLLRLP